MKEYTEAAKRFYKSKQWERTRKLYVDRVHGMCERCAAAGLVVPGKIVHHKIYLDDAKLKNPAIALNFANLELLCQDCHNKEHMHREPARRYTFDASGNLIERKQEQCQ